MKNIVLGLLADANTAQTALNNFTEADFNLKDISVIMQSQADANKVADPAGPLKNVEVNDLEKALEKFGMQESAVNTFIQAIKQNKVLLAIAVSDTLVNAAKDMLKDYKTEQITVL